jgi:hypothetical protein
MASISVVVSTTPKQNCFVSLAPTASSRLFPAPSSHFCQVVKAAKRNDDAGSESQPIYLGWKGEVCREQDYNSGNNQRLEISAIYASCLGIKDGDVLTIERFTGDAVGGRLPVGKQVQVSPASEDDWEVVEVSAETLEMTLLGC